METKEMNKTDFAAVVEKNGEELRQLVFDGGAWYEQVVVDGILCRHKVLTIKQLSADALEKKAKEVQPGNLPMRLREQATGPVLAFVCFGKSTLYYHAPLNTREGKARAQQIVLNYSKSLIAKSA